MASRDAWHVEPDGDWVDGRDGGVLIRKLSVGEMDNNVYVIRCATTGQALVVDAAAHADRIREAIDDAAVVGVVQTHGHWDHVRAWQDLRTDPGVEIWGHAGDLDLFPEPADRQLSDGEVIDVGELEVEVIHLPGHTPGSLLFLVRGAGRAHLFSGDTLFPGGPGRTTSPADFRQIMDGLEATVFDRLDDDTRVHPGHGDSTTIGVERGSLGEWRQRGW